MGRYKEIYDDEESKVIEKDTYLCSNHIHDYAIKAEILKWSYLGVCSYCNKRRKVVLYKDILPFIKNGVARLYSNLDDEGLFLDSEDQKYLLISADRFLRMEKNILNMYRPKL